MRNLVFWIFIFSFSLGGISASATTKTGNNQLFLAHAQILANHHPDAIRTLRAFDPQSTEDIDALNYMVGKIYLNFGNPNKAIECFSLIIEGNIWYVPSRIAMTEALLQARMVDVASTVIEELEAIDKPPAALDYLIAMMHEVAGHPELADMTIEKSRQKNVDGELPVLNLARLLVFRGRQDEAIKILVEKVATKPGSAALHASLSELLSAKKIDKEAEIHARLALAIYQQAGDALHERAMALRLEKWSKSKSSPPEISEQLPVAPTYRFDTAPINKLPAEDPRRYLSQVNKFPFPNGSKIRGGSGIVVDGGNKVITNRHVIEGGKEFAVRNGLGDLSKARVMQISDTDDLAVLVLEKPFPSDRSFDLRQMRAPEPGGTVVVMGYPLWYLLGGITPSISNGVVAKSTGFNEDPRLFQLTAKINKGNSGGPVFDLYGNLVGITQGKLDTQSIQRSDGFLPEDVNFAIPVHRLSALSDLKITSETSSSAMPIQRPEEIYREMAGKVVMVAVVVD